MKRTLIWLACMVTCGRSRGRRETMLAMLGSRGELIEVPASVARATFGKEGALAVDRLARSLHSRE
jgi:hypothetical protein